MTAASFADDMVGGGGKYAAVFFVAGQTSAQTTSAELVAALADPNPFGTSTQRQQHSYRRLLFGRRKVMTTPTYCAPSDHVQIIPSLDADLGKQSISYDESKGLTGGGWSVKFGRDAHGAEYSHFRSGAVAGTYDGLDVMPDPIYDSTVKTGILAKNWDGSGGGATLTWGNDRGLYDLIVANDLNDDPTYIWIKNSCLGVHDAADIGGGKYTAEAFSGCLRTPREKIFVDQVDHSSHMLVSAPSTSIVGRAATLWLVPMTDDGQIVDIDQGDSLVLSDYTAPVMFRCGPVLNNPTCGPEQWKIDCGFWEDFLNVNIPVEAWRGQLRGYRFHRQPAAATGDIQMPHLEINEWNGANYVQTHIWLCDPGEAVSYGTKTLIAEALNAELAARTHSSPLVIQTYHASYGELYVVDDVAKPAYINGPLAWILKLGLSKLSAVTNQSLQARRAPKWEAHYGSATWDPETESAPYENGWLFVPDDTTPTQAGWELEIPGRMQYYYQFNFANQYWCELNGVAPLGTTDVDYYPLAYYTPGAAGDHYRLSIRHEFDAQQFGDGDLFTVGGPDKWNLLAGKVDSTGDNYVVVDDQDAIDGVTTLKSMGDDADLIPPRAMRWGQPLYHWPALHKWTPMGITPGDPFPVSSALTIESESLSDLIRAILGDDPIQIPQRTCVYHIPDGYDDGEDMRGIVDYDRLDELAPAAATPIFRLQLGTSFNLRKTVFNVLLSLGIRQTWGYDESKRAWVMSFEPLGVVMASKAIASGRIFDNNNLKVSEPSAVYGNTWLYHHAKVKYNYVEDKPFILEVENVTGRAMLASGNKTLNIDDKIIQVEGSALDSYFDKIRQILYRMNSAKPSISLKGTVTGIPLSIVGGDCLLSSALPYDLFKGVRGMTRRAALLTKVTTSITKTGMNTALDFRLAKGLKGIGPAIKITAAKMVKAGGVVACAALNTDPTANEFASPLKGLTDLAYFGCFDWNASTDTVSLRSCSCARYAITIVDENTTAWDTVGAGRNVFRGRIYGNAADTLELADITNGTCKISIDDDYANFDETTDKIMFFAEYNNANLQQCQVDMYGWLGDKSGSVENSDSATSRAMTWG